MNKLIPITVYIEEERHATHIAHSKTESIPVIKKKEQYVFSKDELSKLLNNTWQASERCMRFDNDYNGNPIPKKKEYMSQLLN